MENATKALLIAGGVLIAILLIAMGMKIFNSGAGAGEQVGGVMDTTAVTTFNSQFTKYIRDDANRTQVNSLIQKVMASNASNVHKVELKGNALENPSTGYWRISSAYTGNKFKVRLYDGSEVAYDGDGYIVRIWIHKGS